MVNLGDVGLEDGDEIDQYLSDYEGESLIEVPAGTYEWNGYEPNIDEGQAIVGLGNPGDVVWNVNDEFDGTLYGTWENIVCIGETTGAKSGFDTSDSTSIDGVIYTGPSQNADDRSFWDRNGGPGRATWYRMACAGMRNNGCYVDKAKKDVENSVFLNNNISNLRIGHSVTNPSGGDTTPNPETSVTNVRRCLIGNCGDVPTHDGVVNARGLRFRHIGTFVIEDCWLVNTGPAENNQMCVISDNVEAGDEVHITFRNCHFHNDGSSPLVDDELGIADITFEDNCTYSGSGNMDYPSHASGSITAESNDIPTPASVTGYPQTDQLHGYDPNVAPFTEMNVEGAAGSGGGTPGGGDIPTSEPLPGADKTTTDAGSGGQTTTSADKIGQTDIQTPSGWQSIDIVEAGTLDYEPVEISTPTGWGVPNLVDPADADTPIEISTADGWKGVHSTVTTADNLTDFASGDENNWADGYDSSVVSNYTITAASQAAYSGDYGMEIDTGGTGEVFEMNAPWFPSSEQIESYPQPGETYEFYFRLQDTAGAYTFAFGIQNEGSAPQEATYNGGWELKTADGSLRLSHYSVDFDFGTNTMDLLHNEAGSSTNNGLDEATFSSGDVELDTWYHLRVDWRDVFKDSISATIYKQETDGSWSNIATVWSDDTQYTQDYESGGIGFGGNYVSQWDFLRGVDEIPGATGWDTLTAFDDDGWVSDFGDDGSIEYGTSANTNYFDFTGRPGVQMQAYTPSDSSRGVRSIHDHVDRTSSSYNQMYQQFTLSFGDDFLNNATDNGALPGFGGSRGTNEGYDGNPANGTGWSARMAWRDPDDVSVSGAVQPAYYVYHMDTNTASYHHWDTTLDINLYYTIGQYIHLGTAGENDGVLQAWVNGSLEFEKTDIQFRASGGNDVQWSWMDFTHDEYAQNATPNNTLYLYLDDFRIWRGVDYEGADTNS